MEQGADLFIGRLREIAIPLTDGSKAVRLSGADDFVGDLGELTAGLR
jgi:hypothetical protein